MEAVTQILFMVQWLLLAYFLVAGLYNFTYSLAGLFRKYSPDLKGLQPDKNFVVLIPGYKEDEVIVDTAANAIQQNYPSDLYDVVVIADSFSEQTLKGLRELPIRVIEVEFVQSSKAKSINKVMEQLDGYDYVCILDADNIMEKNFLLKMYAVMDKGFKAVQGHRVAKNLETSFSYLDAISEEVNNHIFRRGHRALGLSSALIGSGMAFDFELFKRSMRHIDSFAEDKELEINLFRDNYKIEFVDGAYVYDEKVSQSKVFVKQRSRWVANQFIYARMFFLQSLKQLFKGNVDYFDKIFQYLLPPRVVLLGFVWIALILSLIFNPLQYSIYWMLVFLIANLAIAMAVPKKFWIARTLKHLIKLPWSFVLIIVSMMKFRQASKGFNPTPHSTGSGNIKNPEQ